MTGNDASPRGRGSGAVPVFVILVLALLGGGWAWLTLERRAEALDRAEGALRLQVLTSRLGAAAMQAEYGDYDEALTLVSGVFDGIQNYGIEHGALPQSYAEVLATRDVVVRDLAREMPSARDRLVATFFRLQIPVDTQLDPERIIPATETGAGLRPPMRRSAAADSVEGAPDSLPGGADTARVPRGRAVTLSDSVLPPSPDTVP